MRLSLLLLLSILLLSCNNKTSKPVETHQYTNDLIHESSPYLLQHAHNPVNWNAWNEETLAQAKKENKLLLISIGYAACHWCHVMERESFQDSIVASIMNDKFINVKVDREERPDIDQVYMNAVQLMTGSGGWPLNVIALPDGRPVWGGTYFSKEEWSQILNQVSTLYQEDPKKMIEYATKLEAGIKGLDLVEVNTDEPIFTKKDLETALNNWKESFDHDYGGYKRSQKFMMPDNYDFLLRYAFQNNDKELMNYVELTLDKMAFGGVYDHVGGGFSRYATDTKWHVPHFEKMLYDNAQLVSLYSNAYKVLKKPLYKNTVYETLKFVERELYNTNGYFYSSLDADSDTKDGHHEEGAFYVWTANELKSLLKDDFSLFAAVYNINDFGKWEKDNYVLIRKDGLKDIAAKHSISIDSLEDKLISWKKLLLEKRAERARPNLDDKTLTSWNALMLKGYLDAYKTFNETHFLDIALKNANFILNKQSTNDGGLYHSFKDGKSSINGYLEDYATTIEAFIDLYEITLETKWLNAARDLTNYTFDNFYDDTSKMFYFTSNKDKALVSRSIEYRDNVIPASNSVMANNLFELSHHFENKAYEKTASQMLNNVKAELIKYPSAFSNWQELMLNHTNPYYEIAIVGGNSSNFVKQLQSYYIPNKLIAASESSSNLPLLKSRFSEGNTLIYICQNSVCKLPTDDIEKAKSLINY